MGKCATKATTRTGATDRIGRDTGVHTMDDAYIPAWQCIGCGRIESPQTCIGVCRDRKVMLVSMEGHRQALDEIQRLYGELEQARGLLSRIAHTTPRDGQWEASWRAFGEQARRLLDASAG